MATNTNSRTLSPKSSSKQCLPSKSSSMQSIRHPTLATNPQHNITSTQPATVQPTPGDNAKQHSVTGSSKYSTCQPHSPLLSCKGSKGQSSSCSFFAALRDHPPPLPPHLIRKLSCKDTTGVGKVS